jgi:AraC-like DNA-binding protein
MDYRAQNLQYICMPARRRKSHVRPPLPATPLPFCVRTVGRIRNNPYHSTRGTYHDDAMLTVCLAGRGRYVLGETAQQVGPGTVGLVLPDGPVGVLMADPDDPYDHCYCRFAGAFAIDLARRVAGPPEAPFVRHPAWAELADILQRLEHVHQPDQGRHDCFQPADAVLAEALALLTAPPPQPAQAVTTRRLLDYMHNHLAEPADLAAMAEHFGISKAHLCRVARPLLGETVHRAWQSMKMRWARSLLEQSPLAVSEVARRVGFTDPFYFSRVFRRHIGMTPRDARSPRRTERE